MKAVLLEDTARGKASVSIYADACLLLDRVDVDGLRRAKLVRDLARDTHVPTSARLWRWVAPSVEAASRCDGFNHGTVVGQWRWREGGWLMVRLRYSDGCESVQAFDEHSAVAVGDPRWLICRH